MGKIEKNKSAVMKDKSNLMKFAHKFILIFLMCLLEKRFVLMFFEP